jgi:hypothetical protein
MIRLATLICLLAAVLAAQADSRTAVRPSPPVVKGARTVTGPAVSFRFASREAGVPAGKLRFRCAFDSTRLHACAARVRARLSVGRHTLRVRAVDPRGRASSTTLVRITVKAPPPLTPSVAVGSGPVNIAFGAGAL